MSGLTNWFTANRAKIGGVVSTIYTGVVTIDPQLVSAHPRLFAYLALGFGIIFGAGAFKSDKYHQDQQDLLK